MGNWFNRIGEELKKDHGTFADKLNRLLLGSPKIDDDMIEELEEILIQSDLGINTTQRILQSIKEKNDLMPGYERKDVKLLVRNIIVDILESCGPLTENVPPLETSRPYVYMIVGVNGVGKTTTIAKLAKKAQDTGKNVLLVAADTFRAAAINQLEIWGKRINVDVIRHRQGSDPSAVVHDGLTAAKNRDADVVIIDTAGRLQTKHNLMSELEKMHRVMSKVLPGTPHEVLLVLDSTTGQNALSQARLFKEVVGVTGIALTKLDGTAKGGIVVAIAEELQIPVKWIGIGEGVTDLTPFSIEEFTDNLIAVH